MVKKKHWFVRMLPLGGGRKVSLPISVVRYFNVNIIVVIVLVTILVDSFRTSDQHRGNSLPSLTNNAESSFIGVCTENSKAYFDFRQSTLPKQRNG